MTQAKRHVIVTGSRTGIGLEIALKFLGGGDVVVLSSRRIDQLPQENEQVSRYVESGQAHLQSADLSTMEGCQVFLEKAMALLDGKLDVLVNNAGRFFPSGLMKTTPEQWRQTMALNLDAAFYLIQGAAPQLIESKGCVVNISSIGAHRPDPGIAAYAISKAGLDMLTRSAAQEFAGQGVRVNSLNPGYIQTPLAESAGVPPAMVKKFEESTIKKNPMQRIGTPHDVAAAALFLADGNNAGWITGHALVIDGGQRSFAT